jgi:hypothetical protein
LLGIDTTSTGNQNNSDSGSSVVGAMVLGDPFFAFTAPLWKKPLGSTHAMLVLSLTHPEVAVGCLMGETVMTFQDAIALWWLHFHCSLRSVIAFILAGGEAYVQDMSSSFGRRLSADLARDLSDIYPQGDQSLLKIYTSAGEGMETECPKLNSSIMEKLEIPQRMMNCFDALVSGFQTASWMDICEVTVSKEFFSI